MLEGVRPAGPEDDAQCQALFEAARAEMAARRGGAELLGGSWPVEAEHQVLLGTFDGATLGIAAGWIDPAEEGPTGRLACCYVEPGARGVGLGSALLEELVRWFSDQGCVAVDAPALPGDRATKQLLEQSGFRARLLVLRRTLR